MWTVAASLSAQLNHVRHVLYEQTRKRLEDLESKDINMESPDLEHVQARLLLVIFEFMHTNYQRGWVSAGRCFRLIQLLKLYEIDSPDNIATWYNASEQESWVRTEEKRRTFWMAYCLDRFISMRHEWPLTFTEQVVSFHPTIRHMGYKFWCINSYQISTRLPAPEEDFQGSMPVMTGFLSEAITSLDPKHLSSFAECIILATIYGRAIGHRHQSAVEHVYSIDSTQDFWSRHQWLDTILTTRIQVLSMNHRSTAQHVDSMLLFINMVAQAILLYLCEIIENVSDKMNEFQNLIIEFKQRSLAAAGELVNLTKVLSHLSCFKVIRLSFAQVGQFSD
jgi:hypothetical protein